MQKQSVKIKEKIRQQTPTSTDDTGKITQNISPTFRTFYSIKAKCIIRAVVNIKYSKRKQDNSTLFIIQIYAKYYSS